MAAATGRRSGAGVLTRTEKPVAAGVAVPRHEVIAVGVPLAAIDRGNGRTIRLPE